MRIAILYICTGKYSVFWPQFYNSCERNLLIDHEKQYFVFSDDKTILTKDNIHVHYKKAEGFPLDSLLRFEIFNSIVPELQDFDYVYFFNSNMFISTKVGEEIFPIEENSGLVGVVHPGYFLRNKFWFPFERNLNSSAYIKNDNSLQFKYFMGSFNGGRAKDFIKFIDVCMKNIQSDLNKNIIAIYHDESHLNKYFNERNVLALSPSYAYPEDSDLPFEKKIIIINKVKHGGSYFDKLPSRAYLKRANKKIKHIFLTLRWLCR